MPRKSRTIWNTLFTFFYKNELFHKKFFDGFAQDLLSGFLSGLTMGLGSYGMGGDFNTGYAVGAMSELSKQAYRDAVLPAYYD